MCVLSGHNLEPTKNREMVSRVTVKTCSRKITYMPMMNGEYMLYIPMLVGNQKMKWGIADTSSKQA